MPWFSTEIRVRNLSEDLDIAVFECQRKEMIEEGIRIQTIPAVEKPILIAGFDGWGNALDISSSMVTYLIRKLKAECFAKINPDPFYRYDETRPVVNITNGDFKHISSPGGSFYAARTGPGEKDLVLLKAGEPNLRWYHFVSELFRLCETLNVDTIITLGSMYDQVLHTDRVVSSITSSRHLRSKLKQKNVTAVNYQGPGAIHSLIHSECLKRNFRSVSLWCHCPYYLQDITHFGILSHLGSLLSFLGKFNLDTSDLDRAWEDLNEQIQVLIESSPKVQAVINELRKEKVRGSWASVRASDKKSDNVINLKDFLEPK
jgi:proteasome assembly chaperone (PAC2) family protein